MDEVDAGRDRATQRLRNATPLRHPEPALLPRRVRGTRCAGAGEAGHLALEGESRAGRQG